MLMRTFIIFVIKEYRLMAHLNKKTDNYDPGILSVILDPETNEYIYVSINNNIMKHDDSIWSWDALELPDFALYAIHNADNDTKYKVLIAHIVKAYYDANDEMAVIANYIGNPENNKYKSEFEELQKCRADAKVLAKYIIANKLF